VRRGSSSIFAQNFFGCSAGVSVGGIEEVDAGVEADVDEARGFLYVGVTPRGEEVAFSAKGAGAEREYWDFESGVA